jgi:RimJ/RimL family protein N-acetyltransferase
VHDYLVRNRPTPSATRGTLQVNDASRCLASDGVVELWTPRADDAARLVAGRDALFHRWLGAGSDAPAPTACIRAGEPGDDGTRPVIGWIDFDASPAWLREGEANIGYNVFAHARGRGYATRALQLLMHHLSAGGEAVAEAAAAGDVRTGVLLIDPANRDSQAVASRAHFGRDGVVRLRDDDAEGQWRFVRRGPPLEYLHEGVRIRMQDEGDLAMDLAAKDGAQQRWLWSASDIAAWTAMTEVQRQQHALAGLRRNVEAFRTGPKWAFSIDCDDARCVGYIDADLANPRVPAGEANIAYAVHPAWRGRGVAARAVRAVLAFLREHTAARQAHLVVEDGNTASMNVAREVAGTLAGKVERFTDEQRRSWTRWVLPID